MRRPNSPPDDQAWVWLPRDLLESAAWLVCPDSARRAIFVVLVEHMRQGGQKNGELVVTWRDFKAGGIRDPKITVSLAQARALGFLKLTQPGRRAYGTHPGAGQMWAITWYPIPGIAQPTNEWKRFDIDTAKAALASLKPEPEETVGEDIISAYAIVGRETQGFLARSQKK